MHIGRYYKDGTSGSFDVRRTVQTVIHPQWNKVTNANDIALLLLDTPSSKQPIQLVPGVLTDHELAARPAC